MDNSTENMIFSYKPPNTRHPGPLYTGRENVTRAGSLVIRRSALNDTGYYTVVVDTGNGTQRATGWLEILSELSGQPMFPMRNRKLALKTLIGKFLGGLTVQGLSHLKVTLESVKVAL